MTRANNPPPHRRAALLLWTLFLLWLGGQLPLVVSLTRHDQQPIDFLAYARAADALRQGQSPYGTVAQSRAIWRSSTRALVIWPTLVRVARGSR